MSRRSIQTNTAEPISTAFTRMNMINRPAMIWDAQDGRSGTARP